MGMCDSNSGDDVGQSGRTGADARPTGHVQRLPGITVVSAVLPIRSPSLISTSPWYQRSASPSLPSLKRTTARRLASRPAGSSSKRSTSTTVGLGSVWLIASAYFAGIGSRSGEVGLLQLLPCVGRGLIDPRRRLLRRQQRGLADRLVWRVSLYPILLAGPPGQPERPPAASVAQAAHLLVHHVDRPPRRRDRDDRSGCGPHFLPRQESSRTLPTRSGRRAGGAGRGPAGGRRCGTRLRSSLPSRCAGSRRPAGSRRVCGNRLGVVVDGDRRFLVANA
jgi:hypothetical protein